MALPERLSTGTGFDLPAVLHIVDGNASTLGWVPDRCIEL